LAEFSIAIEVFYGVVVCMGDCVGRADVGAGKAGNAILGMLDNAEPLFRIQFKNLGRADIYAQFTAAA